MPAGSRKCVRLLRLPDVRSSAWKMQVIHRTEIEDQPGNVVLRFGKHRGKRLTEVPNAYLGWLTMWRCSKDCCNDSDCDEECGNEVKVRRLTVTNCGAYSRPDPCTCSRCEALTFLAKQRDVVSAAREVAEMKHLCCECWSFMPPIGDARANGAGHLDWSSRFLHKSCWRELMRD